MVGEGGQLALGGQLLEGLSLPGRLVALDELEDARFEHQPPSVGGRRSAGGLLLEAGDPVPVDDGDRAEAGGGTDRGHGGQQPVAAMELDGGPHVDVAHAVAVGQAEGFPRVEVGADALDAPAGHGVEPGIDQGDPPWQAGGVVVGDPVLGQVDGDVGVVEGEVREVLLDQVALVPEADHEVVDAVGGVDHHDVPDDRAAADLHQGLRLAVGLLGQAGAHAAGEDDGFHGGGLIAGGGTRRAST
jgi:hypothetical protein